MIHVQGIFFFNRLYHRLCYFSFVLLLLTVSSAVLFFVSHVSLSLYIYVFSCCSRIGSIIATTIPMSLRMVAMMVRTMAMVVVVVTAAAAQLIEVEAVVAVVVLIVVVGERGCSMDYQSQKAN